MQCDFLTAIERQRQITLLGEPFQMRSERFAAACLFERSKQLHVHITFRIAKSLSFFNTRFEPGEETSSM